MQSGRLRGIGEGDARLVESKERLMAYNWQRGRTCEAVKRKKRGGEEVRDHTRFQS